MMKKSFNLFFHSCLFNSIPIAATIYPVRSSLQQDPTKRGGRWQSDFIWNSNWQEALQIQEDVRRQIEQGRKEAAEKGNSGDGKGFLSLTSKVDLNSMEVDLSEQLKPRQKSQNDSSTITVGQEASRMRRPSTIDGYPAVPATRGEVRAWDRSGRYSKKVIATPTTAEDVVEMAAQAAAEQERYDQLKKELQQWATGLTAVSFAATFAFYGRDTAASYGVGAVGGLVYLRLLNKSIDGFGYGGMGAALGQNRLLIPLILALGYNRYNLMFAGETGVTLQLLPMLVGFFTYKGAVIARQSLILFGDLTAPYTSGLSSGGGDGENSSSTSGSEGYGNGGGENGENDENLDVTSVDRAFNGKILRG